MTSIEYKTTIVGITAARDYSARAWERAVDFAQIDEDQHGHPGKIAAAESAMESCLDAYTRAIDALHDGDVATTREALDEARSLEREYGDDTHASTAISLLDDIASEIKINVFRDGTTWFGARWINGKYDGCDELDIADDATDEEALHAGMFLQLSVVGPRVVSRDADIDTSV